MKPRRGPGPIHSWLTLAASPPQHQQLEACGRHPWPASVSVSLSCQMFLCGHFNRGRHVHSLSSLLQVCVPPFWQGPQVGSSQPEEATCGHGEELVATLDVGDVEGAAGSSLFVCRDLISELGLHGRRGCCHLNKKTILRPPVAWASRRLPVSPSHRG